MLRETALRSMEVEREYGDERIKCIQMLPLWKKVVLGIGGGRLLLMDATIRSLVRAVPASAHVDVMTSLATGASKDVLVPGLSDGTS